MFRCLLHHLRVTIALLAQKSVCFLQCFNTGLATKCEVYRVFFLIYSAVTIFKAICISSLCILKILKMLVTNLNCSTLISVGFCYLLCMVAIYVFTLSSRVWYMLFWRS